MPNRPSDTSAAILATSLHVSPLDPTEVLEQLQVPGVRRFLRSTRAPLDLSALIFRYRVTGSRIEVVRDRHGAVCAAHGRH